MSTDCTRASQQRCIRCCGDDLAPYHIRHAHSARSSVLGKRRDNSMEDFKTAFMRIAIDATLASVPKCREIARLLNEYTAALSAFHDAQEAFLERVETRDPEWYECAIAKDTAFRRLLSIRHEYWEHLSWHHCGQTGDLTAHITQSAA